MWWNHSAGEGHGKDDEHRRGGDDEADRRRGEGGVEVGAEVAGPLGAPALDASRYSLPGTRLDALPDLGFLDASRSS
jgi:hypothetical protein